jgi:hypothetical protein
MGEGEKPEYRRKQEAAEKERQECKKHDNSIKIIAALDRVADEQHAANDENTPKEKGKRCREIVTIAGLYLAATVAIIAVLITHKDSSDQIGALNSQLTVMQGQLKAMEADQRPWIKIEATIAGPLTFFEPVGFAGMPMHFMLTNVGHSPAFNVRLTAWSFLLSLNHHDLEREWGERCENFKRTPLDNPARGMILFPSDQLPWDQSGIGLTPDDIKKNIIDEGGNKGLDVWIYGCADYVFGEPKAHHQTGFVYRLGHLIPSKGVMALSFRFEPHGTFPAESMTLTSSQSASGQTN